MATNTLVRNVIEGGELVWRARSDNTEVFRIGPTGIDYPGLATTDPWVFDVTAEEYGAVGDGVTDDTAAINAAVAAAFAYAEASDSCFAVVYFPVGVYLLGSATTKGGVTLGNAQIPIPVRDNDAVKVTLVFKGPGDASAMPYWEQDSGSRWGATLKTTLVEQEVDAEWGPPSVIGGPAVSGSEAVYDGNDFNNMLLVIDGIGISTPVDPTVMGFDFAAIAELIVESAAVVPDYIGTGPGAELDGSATNDWSTGMRTPRHTNNDLLIVRNFTCYGQYVGMTCGEHGDYGRLAIIYCNTGIVIFAQQENIHSSSFDSVSVEACVVGIQCIAAAEIDAGAPVFMAAVSMETITTHILDSNDGLCGEIHFTALGGSDDLVVTGGNNVRIIAANQALGALTEPAVPATTVALKNPFWVNCSVLLDGGTVTNVALDGVATGITDAQFPVVLPVRSGGTITLTYSDAPTWKWIGG